MTHTLREFEFEGRRVSVTVARGRQGLGGYSVWVRVGKNAIEVSWAVQEHQAVATASERLRAIGAALWQDPPSV